MTKSNSHKTAQSKAVGKNGTTEHKLPNGKRATEVELSGNYKAAANRLKASGASQKVMQVPNHCMDKAAQAMKNMGGTKRKSV
jgi:hypothetical protein